MDLNMDGTTDINYLIPSLHDDSAMEHNNTGSGGTILVDGWITDAEGNINVTALLEIFRQLSPSEKIELYHSLGIEGYTEFYNMYIKPYEEQLMEYVWYKRSKILLYYIPPILLLIGTVGNLLSFLVLMRRSMRNVSAYNYLAVLSVTDTLVLYVGLLRIWIGELTGYDIKDHNNVVCKLINVVGFTVSDYSVWLLIAVTVERYIVTVHALKANSMCTQSRARKVIVGILILLFLINSHFFVTTEIRYFNQSLESKEVVSKCDGAKGYELLASEIWPWVDAIIYSFLPFVVIIILNIKIIQQVARSLRHRRDLREIDSLRTLNSTQSRKNTHNVTESGAKITVMLLTISFVFLLTTLPMNITMIVTALSGEARDVNEATKFKFARTVTELLMYTNHSINFFLYLVTGQKFRQQLKAMFRRQRNVSWGGSVYSEVEKTQNTEMNGLKERNHTKL